MIHSDEVFRQAVAEAIKLTPGYQYFSPEDLCTAPQDELTETAAARSYDALGRIDPRAIHATGSSQKLRGKPEWRSGDFQLEIDGQGLHLFLFTVRADGRIQLVDLSSQVSRIA